MKPFKQIRGLGCLATTGFFILTFAFALGAQTTGDFAARYARLIENPSHETDDARLKELFSINWDYLMNEYPEWGTDVGYPGQNRRWTDNSLEAIERRKHDKEIPLKVLKTIDRSKLDAGDQLNYDLFKRNLEQSIEGDRFKGEYLAITQLGGVQQEVPQMLEVLMPHRSVQDYEDILARLKGVPTIIQQTLVLLKRGLETGVTPPRITLRDVPQQVESQLAEDPKKNPMLQPFNEFPASIPASEQERLRGEAASILTNSVIPAFRELHEFLVKTYLPGARESIGMSALPDGQAWYAYNLHQQTTTRLTPKAIHELGLREVKRIRKEMDDVIKESGFKGGFKEFNEFLRTDPRFYYTNANDLLIGYRDICKRADPELIKLFGKLPRLPYGVLPVPAYSEKSQTTAYYQGGSLIAGRPGYFYANTYDLKTRPKWEMQPLALHESVPGHHLQLSLALEMENEPEFRKHEGYTAFVEGWGLYAESLGSEMGFYNDPYSKYGRLTYEIWRAIRLVLDTGIHSMGWTRQQAIDYFVANTGKNEHDITVEVDRYIVWPGQACAYKIGELKFKELRAYATKELGSRFNIRTFHDELLRNGALPMDILEKHMREWVEKQKQGASATPAL
ncbi:MAG TPA: DUF885 domain-containing protein [Verrucomicrobiae bacterium]|nr:DUF885 domain-containing protein [Verrucomicrobiae bacterium]